MKRDPERLLDPGDPFDASLLAAARDDAPPQDLEARILSGIGATPPPPARWKLWLGGGVATIAAGAALWTAAPDGANSIATPGPTTTTETPAAAPASARASVDPPAAAPPAAAREPAPRAASRVHAPPPPSVSAAPAPAGGLAEEIALLDQARAAANAGDHARALVDLDAYDRTFPRGTLSEEATLLRVDVLMRAGKTEEARALGQAFMIAHPSTPHRRRLQTLLRESAEPARK